MDCPSCHHANLEGARFCASCGALLPMHPTNEADPLVGQVVGGRYRISRLLGEGGMGRVYLGEQQMGTDVRKVAIKTLHSHLSRDPQIVARFQRECGTVAKLEHPNTIQFFDFGQMPDGTLYIAMEYIQGPSLADALAAGPLPVARVVNILGQVCGSLDEAHALGIVHRDLKPDNVVLTTRAGQADFVKVLDFGIAKRSEAKDQAQEQKLTQQGMVLGTPPYMSPEQFTGKELDLRSDVYSLGVMAYEMLTGRLPFDAETPWQWATQHMTAQPFPFETVALAADIPPNVKSGIFRALSKSPDERQASAKGFFEELAGGAAQPGAGSQAGAPRVAATAAMSAAALAGPADPKGHTQIGGAPVFAPPPAMGAAAPTPTGGGQTFPTPAQPRPATPATPAKGGNKGLVIGLGAAAGALALVGVVMAVRGGKPKDDSNLLTPLAAGSGGPVAVNMVPPEPADSAAVAAAVAGTAALAGTARPGTTTPVRPTPGTTPTAAATTPPTATAPALKGDAACAEARRLAGNGDVGGASRAYASCDGAGAMAARNSISQAAPEAVKRKAFNHDCAGAKAIVASANAAGVGGPAAAALAQSSCK